MPSTASTTGRIELQALGEHNNTWGQPSLNNALTALDEEAAGAILVVVGASDVTLDTTNYTPSVANHYRYAAHKLIAGGGVGARNIIVPSVARVYRIYNATGYTQTIQTSGGIGAAVRTGHFCNVYLRWRELLR
jgi:hypothetical protein